MTTYETEIGNDSPDSWWKLDETSGTTITDYGGGTAANGTISGGYTLNQNGIDGTRPSVYFGGSNGYVDIGTVPSKLQFAGNLTIEAWISVADPTATSPGSAVVTEAYAGDGNVRYMLGFYDGSTAGRYPSFGWYNGSWRLAISTEEITDNAWHHLAGVWDGTALRIYVDGVEKDTETTVGTQPTGTENLYIGRRWDGTSPAYFNGWIDEVAMYNSALSSTRIGTHYSSRNITALSERRFTQAYPLVGGTGTSERRVSQVFLLVAGPTKTTVQKTHGIDLIASGTIQVTHGVDAAILTSVQHDVESTLLKTIYITHSTDAFPVYRFVKSHSIDTLLIGRTFAHIDTYLKGIIKLTHGVDSIRGGYKRLTHNVRALLFLSKGTLSVGVDSYIVDKTVDPDLDNDLVVIPDATGVNSAIRLSRIISRNSALVNKPTINISDAGNAVSSGKRHLINGYDRSSMRWAFADGDTTTNGGYRIFPDFDKIESELYQEKRKVPWVSSSKTNANGAFSPSIVFTLTYDGDNVFNMVQIVSERYGKNDAGIITNCEIEWSDDNTNWTSIGAYSGFESEDPWRLQVYYYYDQTEGDFVWSADRASFLANADGYAPLVTAQHKYVRFTVKSISVDPTRKPVERQRYGLFYEVGCYLWDVGIQEMGITSFSVQEVRDTSSQTLSPIGNSAANTFSISGTLAEESLPYYQDSISPLSANHDQFQNAVYIAALGVETTPGEYTYVNYGTFLADEMSISAPEGAINVSGRDYTKILQEEKMPEMVYVGQKLHEVIKDVVERAGIEKYHIQKTNYSLEDLAVGFSEEFTSDDDYEKVKKHNIIWTQDQTCWEFLQSIALADMGAFFFNRNGTFIYRSKEDLLRGDDEPDYNLSEEDVIFSFNSTNEIMKNAFTINYRVPERTKKPVGLWTPTENIVLAAAALAEDVNDQETSILAGDISDWYKQGYFQVDNEIIKYTDRTDKKFLNCERGYLGTKAASHTMTSDASQWNFGGGTWAVGGGVLTATDTANNGWQDTLTVSDVPASEGFNFHATVTINHHPWGAALIIRGNNTNNHYKAIFRAAQYTSQYPGVVAEDNKPLYEIVQVDGGVETTLKEVSFAKTKFKRRILSGIPTPIRVQVHDDEISLFVKNSRVLSYTITKDDKQIQLPAKIGFSARGQGPTTFEKCYVTTLPDDKEGQTIIFSDTFGRPIKEVRKFDITYAPTGGTEDDMNSTPPCWGVRVHFTAPNKFSLVHQRIGPFTATIFMRNDLNGPALLSGQLGNDSVPESIYLNGYAVRNSLEIKHVDSENNNLISRYGRQELIVDVPWIQSETHAQKLLDYLIDTYEDPVLFLDADIHPNILIKLGDIISLMSTGEVWFPADEIEKFYVVQSSVSYENGALSQNLRLRGVT